MTVLLDTNIIIGFLRGREDIVIKYNKLTRSQIDKSITVYNIAELFDGINRVQSPARMKEQLKIVDLMLNEFDKRKKIFSLTREGAKKFAELKLSLERKGTLIPIMDLLIGTIAILNDFKLITSDKKHFEKLNNLNTSFQVEFWD
ncbi:MAG: type II toxin-antitoxin system VapC family toxin [Candidatus Lokiarchaeota archaeon]|nr:type II toxin-antitoxin system VapC family toxin [Candidatus Lokiarchaeota archaeon]